MRIITHTCQNCGTIVAGNVLEQNRVMKCPGLNCEHELYFSDLDDADRQYVLDNLEKFRMRD